jgi:hypothetical protein
MSSPMLEAVLLCQKKKQTPKIALAVVAVMMCGRDLAKNKELIKFCDKWIEENGDPTYKKILSYVNSLGYIKEIAEISLNFKWKEVS